MGHENVGVVVAVGPDAKGVKIGARVLAHPWMGCGECAICKTGEEQFCKTPRNLGVFSDGGYADHIMMPHPRYLFDFGDLPPEKVAPLACSGITDLRRPEEGRPDYQGRAAGHHRRRRPRADVPSAQRDGNRPAIVVDIDPVKREAAKKAGAMATVDPMRPTPRNRLSSSPMAAPGRWSTCRLVIRRCNSAIDCLTKGGEVIVVGLFGGDITISTPFFPLKAMAVQGSYVGSLPAMKELLDLVRAKGLPPVPLTDARARRCRQRAERFARRQDRRSRCADAGVTLYSGARAIGRAKRGPMINAASGPGIKSRTRSFEIGFRPHVLGPRPAMTVGNGDVNGRQ